jgi:hypothetical protein
MLRAWSPDDKGRVQSKVEGIALEGHGKPLPLLPKRQQKDIWENFSYSNRKLGSSLMTASNFSIK